MKYIASCSFGKDSLAMVLRIIEENAPIDEVLFYDTGMEFQAIYDIRDKMLPLFSEHGIKYTELKPDNPFLYDMLEREVLSRKGVKRNGYSWCGGACRWGTSKKTAACDKYTKGSHVYIGIAADETKRLENLEAWKSAPLAGWGMSEADCLEYCRSRGFAWDESGVDLYSILDRVSCWCCANKNRRELKNMYLYLPEYWKKLKDIQSRTERPMKKFVKKGVWYGNVFDMERVFEKELVK